MSGIGTADLDKEIATALSIVPALVAATANGAAVDLSGFTKYAVVVSVGAVTDGTHTLKLQDSPDNSTWTDVGASLLSGSFTALTSASSTGTQEVGYLGAQRYVRVVTTVTGSPSTGGVYSALVIRAGARVLPQ